MTRERAQQVIAEHRSRFGSDISACMSAAEEFLIRQLWLALPYNSTFHATVHQIANGKLSA